MRIAVRAPNWLGDAVMALPALGDLAASFPGAEIDVFARGAAAEVCARLPGGARAHRLPAAGTRIRLFGQAIPVIRRGRYDLGVVFPPSFSSALMFALGGVRRRLGFSGDGRGALLSDAMPRPERGDVHLSEEYRALVARAAEGAHRTPVRVERTPPLGTSVGERAEAAALLGERPRPWIVLAPGAIYGPTKRWPAGSFAELADRLHRERGASVVLTGAAADRDATKEVRNRMSAPALDLAGETGIGTLIALLAAADLVISNDSGAMHLAAAAGAPVVAIFGSTSPAWTRPLGERVAIVRRDEPCAPCFRADCDIGIVCLTRLDVDEVLRACRATLEGP